MDLIRIKTGTEVSIRPERDHSYSMDPKKMMSGTEVSTSTTGPERDHSNSMDPKKKFGQLIDASF